VSQWSVKPRLAALAARLPARPLTRFAPAPTGYLHLGHVVNALYVWGIARALDGRVLLRIEDHDRVRSRPEYERALVEDLAWLGFHADSGPTKQSDDARVYEEALDSLADRYHVYACDCSRREGSAGAATGARKESRYSGRCRTRGLVMGPGRGVRIQLRPSTEMFDDAVAGEQAQDPATQCGDLLVRDRDGNWTYQFAVTVDDHRQNVDLVIRGTDLLDSTGRQMQLGRMLGREQPPVFLHHPVVLKASGEKLSKSSGDTGVRELRAKGMSAAEVIGCAANAAGLITSPRPIDAPDIVELFR
jgi:glutamyl/glutaminyl-tRNA synthetase